MTTLEKLREKRNDILALGDKYGFGNLCIFGSVIRGEDTEQSDIDILADRINYNEAFGRIYFIQEAEKLLGKKVEIAIAKNLHWMLKDGILNEAQPL